MTNGSWIGSLAFHLGPAVRMRSVFEGYDQAAAWTGPAADALNRPGLSATDLIALPLDQRVGAINAAIESFVPAAERAAVAGIVILAGATAASASLWLLLAMWSGRTLSRAEGGALFLGYGVYVWAIWPG